MRPNDPTEAQRGQEARQVLDNPAFKAALETMRRQVVARWKACPIRDKEGQVLLLQLARMTDRFEGLLVGLIENGKLAQDRIDKDIDAERNESSARKWMRRVS